MVSQRQSREKLHVAGWYRRALAGFDRYVGFSYRVAVQSNSHNAASQIMPSRLASEDPKRPSFLPVEVPPCLIESA